MWRAIGIDSRFNYFTGVTCKISDDHEIIFVLCVLRLFLRFTSSDQEEENEKGVRQSFVHRVILQSGYSRINNNKKVARKPSPLIKIFRKGIFAWSAALLSILLKQHWRFCDEVFRG
jgi:hypothetical protein